MSKILYQSEFIYTRGEVGGGGIFRGRGRGPRIMVCNSTFITCGNINETAQFINKCINRCNTDNGLSLRVEQVTGLLWIRQ